ncbi:PDDEXK nuclease domain-containing protein [Aquabacterium sp.]|uniref:PDDEXK nuclease domain-containing protein n=1 Tax=Aquabacterium sp. TaxID=1872578 RepID=UPI0035B48041
MKQIKRADLAAAAEAALAKRIGELITTARQSVVRGIDLVQVHTSFQIGRHIVEHEQQGRARAGYGKALITALAERLSAEFGKGYSRSNLASMRSFYPAYQAHAPIVQTATGQSKLTHQDLGQMQMYMNYFDRYVKAEGENATIGIVPCKKKNEALVEIALPADANIHAREYRLYLPSKVEFRQKLQEWTGEVGDE